MCRGGGASFVIGTVVCRSAVQKETPPYFVLRYLTSRRTNSARRSVRLTTPESKERLAARSPVGLMAGTAAAVVATVAGEATRLLSSFAEASGEQLDEVDE